MLLNLVSFGTWLAIKVGELCGIIGMFIGLIDLLDLVLLVLMLILVVVMFVALLLSVFIFVWNFVEVFMLIFSFGIVLIVLVVLVMLLGVELNWFWVLVSVINVLLAMKELLKGTMDYTMLLAIFAFSTLIAGGLLFFCAKWFNCESVFFWV